jgi:hypothetical protein
VTIEIDGTQFTSEYRVAPLEISYFELADGRGWVSSFYDYHPQRSALELDLEARKIRIGSHLM